jgi:spore germination protein GerM
MYNYGAVKENTRFSVLLWTGLLMLALLAAGCGVNDDAKKPADTDKPPGVAAAKPVKVTLYFADSQAEKLMPEEREVVQNGATLEEAVVNELIKGPLKEGLTKTIPESTKLLSLNVVDGVANVDFSREIQTKHWGGSAGETMTVYSVTNSLAELGGIDKVQLLVEGEKVESLLGHLDTSQPLEQRDDLIGGK